MKAEVGRVTSRELARDDQNLNTSSARCSRSVCENERRGRLGEGRGEEDEDEDEEEEEGEQSES